MSGQQLTIDDRYERVQELATDPDARVMVFVDGQNLYKRCLDYFDHPLLHPHLLAELLAGPRTNRPVSTRFYTGEPDRNIDEIEASKHRNLSRRLAAMTRCGVTVVTRPLRYHWAWGPARDQLRRLGRPGPSRGPVEVWTEAYQRPQEKGIDLAIGLEVVEFALSGAFDVAVVVSRDSDLHEIPVAIGNIKAHLPKPVRIEAAVVVPTRQRHVVKVPRFSFTHQVTRSVFDRVRDDTDYTVDPDRWTSPDIPCRLADL